MNKIQSRSIELDFVRGVAIFLVMAHHALLVPTGVVLFHVLEFPGRTFGATGVDLFFVLSGFLVGGLLLKEVQRTGSVDVKRFIIRRGFKIWPAYFAYILCQIVSRHFPLNTFLWQNLLQIQNYTGTSLLHTWTLSLEEHFYIILVFGVSWMAERQLSPRKMLVWFFSVCGIVIVIRSITIFTGHIDAANSYTHNRLDSLLFGVILVTLSLFFPVIFDRVSATAWPLAVATLSMFILLSINSSSAVWVYSRATLTYVGYAAFLLLALRHSGRLSPTIVYRWIAKVGVYSYSIYLWHLSVRHPCVELASRLPESYRWVAAMVLQFSCAIVLGVLMARLIEIPFLFLRERYFRDQKRDEKPSEESLSESQQDYVRV
jgi:peptidoglycan/LPS O-acetylase OafA/YrhL